MANKDYYSIMGVSRNATDKEIKQAYRRLARKYHPDVNPGDKAAEEKFKEINEANDVLSDPEKRKKYDMYGSNWEAAQQGFGGFGGFNTNGQGFDFSQFTRGFGGAAGGFGDIFGSFFGGGRRSKKGQNVESAITVTLEEAYAGTTRAFNYQVEEECSFCGGSGRSSGGYCSYCHGAGKTLKNRQIEVKIPKGVKEGSKVRIAGQGNTGSNGGASGDLILLVTIAKHPVFERVEDNVLVTIKVPLTTAVLGGVVYVPTLKGTKLELKIPAETQSGKVFKLPGYGMPVLKTSNYGNLMAKVEIQIPTNLSSKEKKLFEELRNLRHEEA
jgi:DnaJ-class molecular chaperone